MKRPWPYGVWKMPKRRYQDQVVQFKPQGVVWDLPAHEVGDDKYTDARNIRFDNGSAVRFNGFTDQGPQNLFASDFIGGALRPVDESPLWLYAGEDGIGVTDGVNNFDITPAIGITTPRALWTATTFNSIPILNNVDDEPFAWDVDTANIMTTLPGWDPLWRCNSIRSFKNFVIAIGMSGDGQSGEVVRWSDAADPGTLPQEWEPTPENLAGSIVLAATPGDIIDGAALRDQFFLYKYNSTYAMQFIGGQFVMSVRKFLPNSGILARNCIAEFQGFHYIMTNDDIVRHDGHTVTSLVDGIALEYVFKTMSPGSFEASQVVAHPGNNEIWFCWPEGDSQIITSALVYDVGTGDFGFRQLNQTNYIGTAFTGLQSLTENDWDNDNQAWIDDITAWNQAQYSHIRTSLIGVSKEREFAFIFDLEDTENGAPVTCFLSKESMDLGMPETIKLVKNIYPRLEGEGGTNGQVVQVRVGTQMASAAPIDWQPAVDFTIGTSVQVNVFARGRFLSVQFSSDEGSAWRCWGWHMQIQEMGRF